MSSLNKVTLIGRLGADPESRTFQNGGEVCNLNLATSETWKDKDSGERKEKTEWHRVVIFNPNLVKIAKAYLKKGSKVYLEGALETRKWTDQKGVEKYSTEIVLRQFRGEMVLLDDKGDKPGQSEHDAAKADGFQKPSAAAELDDEIPF